MQVGSILPYQSSPWSWRSPSLRRQRRLGQRLTGVVVLALTLITSIPADAEAPAGGAGTEIWAARYNVKDGFKDSATSLVLSPDGATAYVVGTSAYDYATVAYDSATGAQIWVARYHGSGNGSDLASDIALSPDGKRVYVTGASWSGTGPIYDYATIAYEAATGLQLWIALYDGPKDGPQSSWDRAEALVVAPDGSRVYVTGSSWAVGFYNVTVAYDAFTGTQVWVTRTFGAGAEIALSPDGTRVFVTGSTTVAYDSSSGALAWVAAINVSPVSLAVSHDGARVFVAGTIGDRFDEDYATVAYSSVTGTELWASVYDGPRSSLDAATGSSSDDQATSLALSPDGTRIYVTGYSSAHTGTYVYDLGMGAFLSVYEDATVAYDAITGAQIWVASELADGFAPSSLLVSPDGARIYVTGGSTVNSRDYATVAFDAVTGTEKWIARYQGPSSSCVDDCFSLASALAVSHDGSRVYVTGHSLGDYATVAYNTGLCAPGRYEDGPATKIVHRYAESAVGAATGSGLHDFSCTAAGEGL